jgi:hypothetical protein
MKGKRPKGWTAKDEEDLTSLVDEIFRVCGPQAVSDTRKACEKMSVSRQNGTRGDSQQ